MALEEKKKECGKSCGSNTWDVSDTKAHCAFTVLNGTSVTLYCVLYLSGIVASRLQ